MREKKVCSGPGLPRGCGRPVSRSPAIFKFAVTLNSHPTANLRRPSGGSIDNITWKGGPWTMGTIGNSSHSTMAAMGAWEVDSLLPCGFSVCWMFETLRDETDPESLLDKRAVTAKDRLEF